MAQDCAKLAEEYYKAMAEKNLTVIERYLDPDVQFKAPLGKASGKEAVLEATNRFTAQFMTLKIRAKFGSENQAIVVYDLEFPAPIGNLSSSALMNFQNGLVS